MKYRIVKQESPLCDLEFSVQAFISVFEHSHDQPLRWNALRNFYRLEEAQEFLAQIKNKTRNKYGDYNLQVIEEMEIDND